MKSQTIKRFLIISILINILMVGVVFNSEALAKNGGKMPVLSAIHYKTNTHFSYQDRDEVERWYFTDIIPLGADRKASIGDIFSISGLTLLVIYSIFAMRKERQEWKEAKNVKLSENSQK